MAALRDVCRAPALKHLCRVFAYGSNLSVEWIEARVGPVVILASGRLDRHALRFHKSGRDGSGKADAFATDDAADTVHGVVYEMSADAKRRLDRFEGLGVDYLEKEVAISTAGGSVNSSVYFAHPARVDPSAVPYDWYLRLVVDGARRHRLPEAYVERIAAQVPLRDPDRDRATRALELLARR